MTEHRGWNHTRRLLGIELALVFVGIPSLLAFEYRRFPPIPVLIVIALAGYLLLRSDSLFQRERLVSLPANGLRLMLLRCFGLCAILGLSVFLFSPGRLFDLPRRNLQLWAAVMIFYPLLSVYPQELLFRVFFFHRYRMLFRNDMSMVLASSLVFGFVHIVFGNWISVGLSAVGGILFAITYLQTGSLLAVCIEHAILGCFLFTIGLGEFFYHGGIR